jgi:hypothetical protein
MSYRMPLARQRSPLEGSHACNAEPRTVRVPSATILKLNDRYTCFTPDFRMIWKAPSVPRLALQRMRASPPSAEDVVPATELTRAPSQGCWPLYPSADRDRRLYWRPAHRPHPKPLRPAQPSTLPPRGRSRRPRYPKRCRPLPQSRPSKRSNTVRISLSSSNPSRAACRAKIAAMGIEPPRKLTPS